MKPELPTDHDLESQVHTKHLHVSDPYPRHLTHPSLRIG